MKFKDIFNWCAQDIDNISPITIPRLLKYPLSYLAVRSAGYPTGASTEFTDYFCRGARIVERAVTLGNVATAVAVASTVTGGLGVAAGVGVYTLGAVFGFAAGHKAHGYFRPLTQEEQLAHEAAQKSAAAKKSTQNDWMSAAGKVQFQLQQNNKKPFASVRCTLAKVIGLR